MALTRLVARPMLGSIFFVGALGAFKNADALSQKAAAVTDKVVPTLRDAGVPLPENPSTLVKLNAAVQVVAATALATGTAPRLAATVLAGSLVPTTLAGHAFWNETDPAAKSQQQLQFAKNMSILGGLVLAATDTEGKPGVAWRARRAVRDVAREGSHLAKETKLEAKLAAARLS